MSVIIVTGIPGVGSSTVIKEALRRKEELTALFVFVNYGDVMFEAAKGAKLVEKRDEIRKLPSGEQRKIQKLACKKIFELGQKQNVNVIVDTHCTIKTLVGYFPGLPEPVIRELKPEQFVLIEATPEEIANRRNRDKSRERDVADEREIEEHQMMNRAISMAYACLTGASVKIIKNHDGGVGKAAENFLELLDFLYGKYEIRSKGGEGKFT